VTPRKHERSEMRAAWRNLYRGGGIPPSVERAGKVDVCPGCENSLIREASEQEKTEFRERLAGGFRADDERAVGSIMKLNGGEL